MTVAGSTNGGGDGSVPASISSFCTLFSEYDMSHKDKTAPRVADDQTGGATDQVGVGTTSIAGAEASELADHGRGPVETNIGKEMGRKLPQQTGGVIEDDTGTAGIPGAAEVRNKGHRKHG
jgi:hypothetical protein